MFPRLEEKRLTFSRNPLNFSSGANGNWNREQSVWFFTRNVVHDEFRDAFLVHFFRAGGHLRKVIVERYDDRVLRRLRLSETSAPSQGVMDNRQKQRDDRQFCQSHIPSSFYIESYRPMPQKRN